MRNRSKRYKADAAKVDGHKKYPPAEAVKLLKTFAPTKADQSVEIAVKLAIDPKKSEQSIRGSLSLPKGIGKARRVIVFADGAEAQTAQEMGADVVGMDDLAAKITGGWLEFDVAVATPDMMGMVGKLGRILGRRGLMPNPKAGTVTFDVERAVGEVKAGRVEFKVDKGAIIHVPVGKASFSAEALVANLAALLDAINRAKPSGAKGTYLRGVTIASTMGPGVRVDLPSLLAAASA